MTSQCFNLHSKIFITENIQLGNVITTGYGDEGCMGFSESCVDIPSIVLALNQ